MPHTTLGLIITVFSKFKALISPLNFEIGDQTTLTGLENLSDQELEELLKRY